MILIEEGHVLIIWQGLGIVAIVIPVAVYVVAYVIADAILGLDGTVRWAVLIAGLSLVASGWLIQRFGRWLDRKPGREVVDKATGEEITLRQAHSLFFLPLRIWAGLGLGLGAILCVFGVIDGIGR